MPPKMHAVVTVMHVVLPARNLRDTTISLGLQMYLDILTRPCNARIFFRAQLIGMLATTHEVIRRALHLPAVCLVAYTKDFTCWRVCKGRGGQFVLYMDDHKVAIDDSVESLMATLTRRMVAEEIASIYLAVKGTEGWLMTAIFHQTFELSRPRDRKPVQLKCHDVVTPTHL
jgi:hypothetical protein